MSEDTFTADGIKANLPKEWSGFEVVILRGCHTPSYELGMLVKTNEPNDKHGGIVVAIQHHRGLVALAIMDK